MTEPVTDVESLKEFLRDRAIQTWDKRRVPYYLSFVATDLKEVGVDYHEFIWPMKLRQWALSTDFPDTKVVAHPVHSAKVGFLPANADFNFDNEDSRNMSSDQLSIRKKYGQNLIQFVKCLENLPDESVGTLQVPAKTLIALLKN